MTITLDGTTGITAPTYGGSVTAEYSVPVTSFKNRIINGAMLIDQRNAGASVTIASGTTYTVDRWACDTTQASKFSVQQSSTAPTGFKNSTLITSLSSYSVGTSDYFLFRQAVEGLNFADLAWGTASASTVTLSFWVRSSLTGTFGGVLSNGQGSSRSYPFSYTISAANTWEQKTITVAGDTTGTWLTTTGIGIVVYFGLGVGSTYSGTASAWSGTQYLSATGATSVVGTNGATWYVTGVQLEKGSTATSFDYRAYGTELMLCQRYYIRWTGTTNSGWPIVYGYAINSLNPRVAIPLNIPMRSTPTASISNLNWNDGAGSFTITVGANLSTSTVLATQFSTTGLTVFRGGALGSDGSSPAGYYDASAEL